jgi:glycosyltransferase involved in cell wall biosynthesis
MESELVSVIIPSYNRFKYLLNAIKSVKEQTYKNVEIIVVNDGSTLKEYYDYDFNIFGNNFKIIHQKENSRKKNRTPSPAANARNIGIEHSNGSYIAFLDDDDVWLPNKLEIQISTMIKENIEMSSHQTYLGNGIYDKTKKYRLGNDEIYLGTIRGYFRNNNSKLLEIENGMPDKITLAHQKIHNLLITSSTIMTKELVDKVGKFNMKKRNEDHEYWNRALDIIPYCLYIKTPLAYYDNSHGDGRLY